MAIDPAAADELGEDGPIDIPRRAQIDVLHTGILAERGQLEARDALSGVAFRGFQVGQQSDAIFNKASRSGDSRCASKALAMPLKPSSSAFVSGSI